MRYMLIPVRQKHARGFWDAGTLVHCALMLAPCVAFAQSLPDPSAELRRQQERQQAQQQQLQGARREVTLDTPTAAQAAPRLALKESPCFPITRVVVRTGGIDAPVNAGPSAYAWIDSALSGPTQDDSPVGKCLGAQGIGLVLKRAQDALISKALVTSRAVAQPQDLSTGNLVVDVVPGRVHAMRFVESNGHKAWLPNAFNSVPIQSGNVLNLRDIEQALENFKRVPTVEADIQIVPSESTPDQSDLVIVHQQSTAHRITATVDDAGSKGTGKYQGSATLSLDNPLGLSDLFYITLNHDLGDGAAQGNGTQGGALHYSLPYGYWTVAANSSSSRYYQRIAGLTQPYTYSGTSDNTDLKLSYLLHRDAVRKTTISLKAWQRKSNNYIDDTEVEVQRRVMGGWELGVGHKEFVGQATLEVNLTHKVGTSDFGSMPAPEEAFNEGTSQPSITTLDASVSLPFQFLSTPINYSATVRAQSNNTRLIAQDRFSIGGRYSVRGFDGETSLAAERGWTLRNDFSTGIESGWGIGAQQIYMGLDFGEVSGRGAETLLGNTLAGVVLGLRGSVQKVQYELFVGAPISKPNGFVTANTTFGFSLSTSL